MDVRFDLAASKNPCRTVFATIQLRLRDFSKNEFLLALSQTIGFHPNGPRIRTQHPRKPIETCPLFENRILQFHWLETEGGLLGGGEGLEISGKKVAHDLLLDERRIPGKFGCTGTYSVQMHKEQTNRQTNKLSSLYIRLYEEAFVVMRGG